MIRLLDHIADWLKDGFGYRAQLRIGVACLLVSVPFYALCPLAWLQGGFTEFSIFVMSALALTVSGFAFIAAAEAAEEAKGDE